MKDEKIEKEFKLIFKYPLKELGQDLVMSNGTPKMIYRFGEKCFQLGKSEGIKKAIEELKSFINYANKERKDNYLWYKEQLNNLLNKIKGEK